MSVTNYEMRRLIDGLHHDIWLAMARGINRDFISPSYEDSASY